MYRFYFNCHRWKPTSNQWNYANRCLPDDDLQHIDQYVYQRDVKYSLIGQLLIRYLYNQVFNEKSSSCIIERTKTNRPFIQTKSSIFDFNLSHHHQLVCIAGTFDNKIGCDTMIYGIEKSNWKLFRRKFTYNEYKLIEKNPLNFFRLWCLKESYVKYLGIGIALNFSQLNFHLQTDDFSHNKIISDTKLDINHNLRFDEQIISLIDNQQQLITLCLSRTNPCQTFVELNIDDILHGCTPFDKNKQNNIITWERYQMKR